MLLFFQDKSWRVRYMVANQLYELCEAVGPEPTRWKSVAFICLPSPVVWVNISWHVVASPLSVLETGGSPSFSWQKLITKFYLYRQALSLMFFLAMILAISKIGGTFVGIFVFSLSWWRILFSLQSNLPCIVCTNWTNWEPGNMYMCLPSNRQDGHSFLCLLGIERSLYLHMDGCYGTMRRKFVLQLQAKWPSFAALSVHRLPHNTFCLVSRWVFSQITHHSGCCC
jgi:hypothetical protein